MLAAPAGWSGRRGRGGGGVFVVKLYERLIHYQQWRCRWSWPCRTWELGTDRPPTVNRHRGKTEEILWSGHWFQSAAGCLMLCLTGFSTRKKKIPKSTTENTIFCWQLNNSWKETSRKKRHQERQKEERTFLNKLQNHFCPAATNTFHSVKTV